MFSQENSKTFGKLVNPYIVLNNHYNGAMVIVRDVSESKVACEF